MSVRFVNNYSAVLAAGISSSDTTLSVPAGYGDLLRTKLGSALGSDHIYATLINAGNDIEIARITATSGDDLTIVRGQDGTTARAWLADDVLSCRPCAASLSEAITLPTDLARSGINIDITELRALTTPLSVAQGGTGATSDAAAPYALKGANTDITSLNAPALGAATATTQAASDDSTKVATTAFVKAVSSTWKEEHVVALTSAIVYENFTVAHTLGAVPDMVQMSIRCINTTADATAGDEFYIANWQIWNTGSAHLRFSVAASATHVYYSQTNIPLSGIRKGTSTAFNFDITNYVAVFKVFRFG